MKPRSLIFVAATLLAIPLPASATGPTRCSVRGELLEVDLDASTVTVRGDTENPNGTDTAICCRLSNILEVPLAPDALAGASLVPGATVTIASTVATDTEAGGWVLVSLDTLAPHCPVDAQVVSVEAHDALPIARATFTDPQAPDDPACDGLPAGPFTVMLPSAALGSGLTPGTSAPLRRYTFDDGPAYWEWAGANIGAAAPAP